MESEYSPAQHNMATSNQSGWANPFPRISLENTWFGSKSKETRDEALIRRTRALVAKWIKQNMLMTLACNYRLDWLVFNFRTQLKELTFEDVTELENILLYSFELNKKANRGREALGVEMVSVEEWWDVPQPALHHFWQEYRALIEIFSPKDNSIGEWKYRKPRNYVIDAIMKSGLEEGEAVDMVMQALAPPGPAGDIGGLSAELPVAPPVA